MTRGTKSRRDGNPSGRSARRRTLAKPLIVRGNAVFNRRTAYSLRHGYICMRFKTGLLIEASSGEFPSSCANLFWWYNMAATRDIGVTPRPIYKSDGRKLPDCYTQPLELRTELSNALGPLPLFEFWGPATSIAASRWIADAALHVRRTRAPTLMLVYLPHLDYDLQRFGPDDPRIAESLSVVDAVAGDLIDDAQRNGGRVIALSEYGITAVSTPIDVNRALRQSGLLRVRVEDGGEFLDIPQSAVFAVADHQIAHLYVSTPNLFGEVRRIVSALPGVECVLDRAEQRA